MSSITPKLIAEALRQDIFAGRIPPRSDLRQVAIADRFAVSRIPVRDALQLLAAEGLAVIVPGRGATVVSLSAAEIEEVFDLRIMLECDSLERAASKIDDRALRLIDVARQKADLDSDTPGWSDGDWSFHEAIYSLAGRPRQVEIIRSLRQTCRVAAAGYETLPESRQRWLTDHAEIVRHLRQGDARSASSAVRDHLEASRDHLLSRLAQ